jgi:YgiT-type zinc finger domain-containing protein
MAMYGYDCEFCEGTVEERLVKKEVFKHKSSFVMLENVPVGICNNCGYRYYHSTILKRVSEIAEGKRAAERTEPIPVAHLR